MFLLTKVFNLREKANPEHEKPFLDHLDDLRIMVTRVIITLALATVICWAFSDSLMKIIRQPVAKLWDISQGQLLPDVKETGVKIDVDTWERAKEIADRAAPLTSGQRRLLFKHLDDPQLSFHSECVIYYRTAMLIKDEQKRLAYVEKLPGMDDKMRKQVLELVAEDKQPNADTGAGDRMLYMQALNPTEGFMLSLKLAFFSGLIISFPMLLYFIMQFILPGLKEKEKRAMWPAMAIGFGLFLIGVLFAYFVVLPKVLDFFYSYSNNLGVSNEWRIGHYITFATQFTLIFGLGFELPVVVMTLVKIGLLNYQMMSNTRRYAILAIFFTAAIITPTPDALTLCLLAVPMYVLYEICIWLAYFHNKKEREKEAAEEQEYREKYGAAIVPAAGLEAHPADDSYHDPFEDEYVHDEDDDHWSDDVHADGEGEECDDGEIIGVDSNDDSFYPTLTPVSEITYGETDESCNEIDDDHDIDFPDDHEEKTESSSTEENSADSDGSDDDKTNKPT